MFNKWKKRYYELLEVQNVLRSEQHARIRTEIIRLAAIKRANSKLRNKCSKQEKELELARDIIKAFLNNEESLTVHVAKEFLERDS